MAKEDLYLNLLKKCLTGTVYEEGRWKVPRSPTKRLVSRLLRKLLVGSNEFDLNRRAMGEDWPVIGFTMIGERRLDNIRTCIERVLDDKVPGDFVECGVWRGGGSIFAKAVLAVHGSNRIVWLADSFEGMPKLTSEMDKVDADYSAVDYLVVSLDQVRENFRKFDLLDDKVRFIKGWFANSLPSAPIDKIAVLRLDGDHYSSTMDALNALHSKLSAGGYLIVDDYNSFEGCKRAVTEFRERHGITSEIVPIDKLAIYWRHESHVAPKSVADGPTQPAPSSPPI